MGAGGTGSAYLLFNVQPQQHWDRSLAQYERWNIVPRAPT